MSEKNSTDAYVEHINSRILPFIDYGELQKSCGTDMVYAKGVLHRLHRAMVEVYGDERLDDMSGDDGFVVIPGIVRGIDSGKLCVALLDLDLHSSGEHWGTTFLCEYGAINQSSLYDKKFLPDNEAVIPSEMREAVAKYMPYDYCYTATIPGDIHIDKNCLPQEIKDVLKDFRNCRVTLLHEDEKPSVIGKIRGAEKNAPAEPKTPKSKKKNEPEL